MFKVTADVVIIIIAFSKLVEGLKFITLFRAGASKLLMANNIDNQLDATITVY